MIAFIISSKISIFFLLLIIYTSFWLNSNNFKKPPLTWSNFIVLDQFLTTGKYGTDRWKLELKKINYLIMKCNDKNLPNHLLKSQSNI